MSDDLIKRKDAIATIGVMYERCDTYDITDYRDLMLEAVKVLPSADRPQEWIPCSERLPKIGEKVLVSTKKTCFVQVFKGIYSDPTRWRWEHNSIKKIDAWMPLPEPWKGADDE